MEAIGWEIQPAGWILLFILIVLLTSYVMRRLKHFSDEK
jgi:hypothetical protein